MKHSCISQQKGRNYQWYNNNNNNNKKKKNKKNTDRELSASNPDIVIKDRANQCCKLTDVLVPSNQNTSTKVIEKLSKYKDLETESMRMWGMRTETVLVIVGALGLLREGMDKNLGKIPGASNINELQKIILLGMAHILGRFLSIHFKNSPDTSGPRIDPSSRTV